MKYKKIFTRSKNLYFCFVGKKFKIIKFYIKIEEIEQLKSFLLSTKLIIKNLNKKKPQNLKKSTKYVGQLNNDVTSANVNVNYGNATVLLKFNFVFTDYDPINVKFSIALTKH